MRISLPTLSSWSSSFLSRPASKGRESRGPLGHALLLGLFLLAACSPPEPGASTGSEADLQPPGAEEGSPVPAPAERAHAGPRVVFLGTSLTEGLGLEQPEIQAWPAQLGELARADEVRVDIRSAGLSGETSAGALRRVDWILEAPGEPAPAVFVLETGANDGLRGLPVAALEANLDSILVRVRRHAPEAVLVVAGMEAPPNLGATYTEAFRAVFPRVAARWDALLVPFLLEGVAGEAELNQADGIHPTAEGHRRMAEVAWPVVRRALERTGPP